MVWCARERGGCAVNEPESMQLELGPGMSVTTAEGSDVACSGTPMAMVESASMAEAASCKMPTAR